MNNSRTLRALVAGLVFLMLAGCNDAEFAAPNDDKEKPVADATDRADSDLDTGTNGDDQTRDDDRDDDFDSAANGGDLNLEIDSDGLIVERFKAEENLAEVDVAFFIDTSGSMDDEIIEVQNRLDGLVSRLTNNDKTKNFQIFIFAGSEDGDDFTPPGAVNRNDNVGFLSTGHEVDSHNGLGVARAFLNKELVVPGLELRDDSSKDLIFITDDQAKADDGPPAGLTEQQFRSFLSGYGDDTDIHVHGIVCPDDDDGCSNRGDAYINLAADPQWEGTIIDLRTPNWEPVFEQLADTISARLDYEFKLSEDVKDKSLIKVELNGDPVDDSDFTYDQDTGTLSFSGEDLEPGDTVIVRY